MSLLVGSLLTFSHIGGEFIPSMDQGEMSVTVTLPAGSTLADTQATTREILDYLLARAEVETVSTAMGEAGGGRGPMGTARGRANRASMTVVLKPGYRGDVLAGEITEKYADFAPARVRASAAAGMGAAG
ncbi:MAG: hypothetical protein DDT20_00659 [Firmicutes bacterium]|nr:hypothetical protein [Bacillota bacterium]